ncbi:oxaloacetate decarboxylase gamma chain [Exilibacterium tricleocarpae]|uniref:Probable oxaloacetate decarboxylase gamma chain n=1 Tax=Exilibacterium tricleocarpae TaxID=2591008 RepID=A0A545SPA7_9GAMM|nr:OadG family protein [Exilibacterium tricleocarpae]TQV66696.1 oxaloacetate decarboxylase gamma chain [Exilibacterium tricleocarpae]
MQDPAVQETLLQQGVNLMLLGMGTVFVFLTLLVIAMTLMSAIVQRYFREPEPEVAAPGTGSTPTRSPAGDTQLLAVIKAAIDQHRGKK